MCDLYPEMHSLWLYVTYYIFSGLLHHGLMTYPYWENLMIFIIFLFQEDHMEAWF